MIERHVAGAGEREGGGAPPEDGRILKTALAVEEAFIDVHRGGYDHRAGHRSTGTWSAEPGSEERIQAVLDEVRAEVSVFPPPAFNRFQNTFSHIFGGGYAAGYYSYKWAEVLSADAWSAFEESAETAGTVLNVETGRRYRQAVLEAGGSRTAMESFKAFRGREPSIDALLRHQGMA